MKAFPSVLYLVAASVVLQFGQHANAQPDPAGGGTSIALEIFDTAVVAQKTSLHCQGEGQSTNLLTEEHSEPVNEEHELKIMREAGKVYLALTNGAFIEAGSQGETLSYANIPNMLGTRSLSYNLSSGAMRYEAVATRHGLAISSYQFMGTCSKHEKAKIGAAHSGAT